MRAPTYDIAEKNPRAMTVHLNLFVLVTTMTVTTHPVMPPTTVMAPKAEASFEVKPKNLTISPIIVPKRLTADIENPYVKAIKYICHLEATLRKLFKKSFSFFYLDALFAGVFGCSLKNIKTIRATTEHSDASNIIRLSMCFLASSGSFASSALRKNIGRIWPTMAPIGVEACAIVVARFLSFTPNQVPEIFVVHVCIRGLANAAMD
jgi:hypothetical protein